MEEKDGNRYQYDPYAMLVKQQNNNGTTSLEQNTVIVSDTKKASSATSIKSNNTTIVTTTANMPSKGGEKTQRKCCACMGPSAAPFWTGLLNNLGICTLLVAYTVLGSFIFLSIEGGTSSVHQHTLASTNRHTTPTTASNIQPTTVQQSLSASSYPSVSPNAENVTFSPGAISDAVEARQRTVENIWDITVSLNILYRENWTRLAALEIARFQDQLIKRLTDDFSAQHDTNTPTAGAVMVRDQHQIHFLYQQEYDWTFARAFLYSLTVLTTIGYGSIAPRTTLGRLVTLAYAMIGIPLTLIYLSSTGGVLARVARGVFSRALCCCLCSNCGYCCYDEKRMAEKERRMKKKRQLEELRSQQVSLQEPYYVRSNNLLDTSLEKINHPETDSLSGSESRHSVHGLALLAPILLCFCMMLIYIVGGALTLYHLEKWPLVDGLYFCFMSLSTIGFGDLVPGLRKESVTTTWFCSIYIMSGMALTAMCFNVLQEEIAHRLRHVVAFEDSVIYQNGNLKCSNNQKCNNKLTIGFIVDESEYLPS